MPRAPSHPLSGPQAGELVEFVLEEGDPVEYGEVVAEILPQFGEPAACMTCWECGAREPQERRAACVQPIQVALRLQCSVAKLWLWPC